MEDQMTPAETIKHRLMTAKGVTWLGMAANVLLAAAKVAAGWAFGSQAILADGFHSASDLITDIAVLAGIGASEKPADVDHPYGHRRISTMVALFLGVALGVVAVLIAYNALVSFRQTGSPVTSFLPLALAVATIPVKEAMFHATRRVGRRTANISLLANAWHHRSDAFSSIAAAAGLTVVAVGGPRWAFVDALTALGLSAFLAIAAARIIYSSCAELIDRAPSQGRLTALKRAVGETEGVRGYHAVRARQIGGRLEMDVHVLVDPNLTVLEGHNIASAVQDSVRRADGHVVEVVVHVEPSV